MKRLFSRQACLVLAWLATGVGHTANATEFEKISSFSLEDGTTVFLLRDSRAPVVSIGLNFTVNSLTPWVVQNHGMAAFECQLFAPEQRLERQREQLGVSLSVRMSWGHASISGGSLASDFPKLIDLMRSVINNRTYDKERIREWTRNRVVNWQASSTNPNFTLVRTAIERLYPYSRDPRVTYYAKPSDAPTASERLARVRDQILSAPGRNIAVSGHIDQATLQELLEGLLPPMSVVSLSNEVKPAPEVFPANTRFVESVEDLTQAYIGYVRHSLPFTSEHYPKYRVLNHVLGGTFSSRLYERLRHESGDTYGVSLSTYFPGLEEGMLLINTFTRTNNAEDAIAKLTSVLAEISGSGATQAEIDAALAFMEGREIFARQTPSSIVTRWARNKLLGLPGDFQTSVLQQAAELSLEEINQFAAEFYDPDHFALVQVVPAGTDG